MATKIIKVRYNVTFEATITVPINATPKDIGDELANLNIPEDEHSKYLEDTFEPEVDANGNPIIFYIKEFLDGGNKVKIN